jgi:hypothetical protein
MLLLRYVQQDIDNRTRTKRESHGHSDIDTIVQTDSHTETVDKTVVERQPDKQPEKDSQIGHQKQTARYSWQWQERDTKHVLQNGDS